MSTDTAMARLIEKQMRNWELARAQMPPVERTPQYQVEDFICVSYAVGSGGDEIAQRLANRLRWPIFDREVLQAMAGGDDIRRQLYESMDERDLHWFEEYVRAFFQDEFDRNDYFRRLTSTILTLARKGHAVFLGRAADLILPPHQGFRVRIMAPPAWCVGRYARTHGCDEATAAERIDQIERDRHEFIQRHFGRRADDPSRFDLILNAASYTPDAVVDIILMARNRRGES